MSNFFILVFLVTIVMTVVFLRKSSKQKKRGEDSSQTMKYGFISIIVAFIAFILVGVTASETEDSSVIDEQKTEAVVDSLENNDETKEENTETEKNSGNVIFIKANELGEYGQNLVLNENTDPYNIIGHFVPEGKYKVTNIGNYPTQVNVYKNEKHVTKEGWEEWSDGKAVLIKVGESAEIEVKDGYFVKVDGNTYIKLQSIN